MNGKAGWDGVERRRKYRIYNDSDWRVRFKTRDQLLQFIDWIQGSGAALEPHCDRVEMIVFFCAVHLGWSGREICRRSRITDWRYRKAAAKVLVE